MAEAYGNIIDPKTQQSLGWAKDGLLRMNCGNEYRLDGDNIMDDDGSVIGRLSTMTDTASEDLLHRLSRKT